MVEGSSALLPPPEESIEAKTDAGFEMEPVSGETAPALSGDTGFVCDCEEWMRSVR